MLIVEGITFEYTYVCIIYLEKVTEALPELTNSAIRDLKRV